MHAVRIRKLIVGRHRAGGGGNSATRKKRVRDKNDKLDLQRRKAAKVKKERVTKNAETAAAVLQEQGAGGVHPSRRARMVGGGKR